MPHHFFNNLNLWVTAPCQPFTPEVNSGQTICCQPLAARPFYKLSSIMTNAINWFELPATNFQRAMKFYGEVLQAELQPIEMGDKKMGFFPHAHEGVGGSIVCGEGYTPTTEGSVVYLNGGDDLNAPLGRVESAGGKVLTPKTGIGENGFIGMFLDSEGNRVAFHSMS